MLDVCGLTNDTPRGYHFNMMDQIKNKAIRRLNVMAGQLRGLKKMVAEEHYCVDIIIQTTALKEALSSMEDLILENHLTTHVVEQIKGRHEKKAIQEILRIYKLSKRK